MKKLEEIVRVTKPGAEWGQNNGVLATVPEVLYQYGRIFKL